MWEAVVYSLVVFVAPHVGFFFAALLSGRRWLFLLPAIVWPLLYLGLYQEWWGSGVGEGWQVAAASMTLISLGAVAIGLMFHGSRGRRGIDP